MRLLAIDTSERYFSVALLESGNLVAQISSQDFSEGDQNEVDYKEISVSSNSQFSRTVASNSPSVAVHLLQMMKALFKKTNCSIRKIELLAVATGPGMFTGLRSGVVAAKTLAYGLGVPLIAVNTLEVMAWQAAVEIQNDDRAVSNNIRVMPVVNAQRQQLFAGFYQINRNPSEPSDTIRAGAKSGVLFGLEPLAANKIMDRSEWLKTLEEGDWATGTGLVPLMGSPLLAKANGVTVVRQETWRAQASTVGAIAWRDYLSGRRDDPWTLEPFYFRPSYAEE